MLMLSALSPRLLLGWLGVGVTTGVVLEELSAPTTLLLVPAGLLGGWLLWVFGVRRELGAGLIGLATSPALGAIRSRNPSCAVTDEYVCEPGALWPWAVALVVLVVAGFATLVAPSLVDGRRKAQTKSQSDPPATSTAGTSS